MENKQLGHVHQIARYLLAFVFVYHGLVPKILYLSPIEMSLMRAHHLDPLIFSPLAGALEILLGACIAFYKRSLVPVYLAMLALIALLIDVAVIAPVLLLEAFNPVTINVASFGLGYIICVTQSSTRNGK